MGNWEENIRKVVPYVPGEQPKEQHSITAWIKSRCLSVLEVMTYLRCLL